MNWRHFVAFLWLRWRLRVNQLKRAGIVNAVITAMFVAAAIPGAIMLFIGAFAGGAFGLPAIANAAQEDFPAILLLIWDGVAALFLFGWSLGLLTDLQRSEALSIDKFLQLPVSISGVFVINYLSSLASLTLLLFVPIVLGLILGSAVGLTPVMLLLLPLVAAFLLAVTGPTYQFQGWLAALMVNPRKRRTVVVVVTMVVLLISQLPQLVNVLQPWHNTRERELSAEQLVDQNKLMQELATRKITPQEYDRRMKEINQEYQQKRTQYEHDLWEQIQEWTFIANVVLPPGWVALGAWGVQRGDVWPALAGTLGLALIGTASLWRAYRTALRLYTGQFNAGQRKAIAPAAVATEKPEKPVQPATAFLERRLPGLSERASAIAFGSFRALIRAPEAKIILLTPIIMIVVFGGMLVAQTGGPPAAVRPLLPFGGMAMALLSMTQLIGNQFGFDRSGFRVFVLSPVPRREILIGKNMAAAPIALGISIAIAVLIEAVYPMRVDVFLAVLVQLATMYLLYCTLANWVSILAPIPVAAGSTKAVNWKTVPLLVHMGFMLLYPFIVFPVLLPFGVQFVVDELWALPAVPIALVLALAECVGAVYLYRTVVTWQGNLLQRREQQILEVVTTKAE